MANKTQHNDVQINFTGTNLALSDSLKDYATRKLRKLLNHFGRIHSIEFVHSQQRNWHRIEITVHGDGIVLRAQERATDAQGATDQVMDKLQRQLGRYREKLIERSRQHGQVVPPPQAAEEPEPAAAAGPGPQIVRTKRFALKPMLPEEAAMQMDLLGHDFFVFSNADTEQVNVLYRRKDGHYGLIEPER